MPPGRPADKAREGNRMHTTYRAHDWTKARPESEELAPRRERDARAEIDRLRDEIQGLVDVEDDGERPRETVDSALSAVTRLQVVTANLDACGPPSAKFAGPAMVALADRRLQGAPDAI